jgi:hypothetical protein
VTASTCAIPNAPPDAAHAYRDRGYTIHAADGKEPLVKGWQTRRAEDSTDERLQEWFGGKRPKNIGAALGSQSGGLTDLDLDCVEAARAAEVLAPATGWIFGRRSRRRSHRIYVVPDPGKRLTFTDPLVEGEDKAMLVELRGNGCQSIVPPGRHAETGEGIEWDECKEPGASDWSALSRAAMLVAAAALAGRYWPCQGDRHHAALALGGALARSGITLDDARRLVTAVCAAAGDPETADRVRAVEDSYAKIVHDEPVTGWPELGRILGEGRAPVVTRLREWLGGPRVSCRGGAAPSPPPADPPWPKPLAQEAFHGLAGDVVRVLEPASEAHPAALLFQLLIAFGNVIGHGPHFLVEADRHHTNEYVVLIGRTSKARKGTSWGQSLRPLAPADPDWDRDRVQSGLSSGEGLIWTVRDPITKRERIREQGTVRYEEVEADPGVGDKRLLVFEPEFANVLKQTERQGNILSTVIRQAWDSGSLRTMTKNNPARATDAHISIVGHITCEELQRYLSATEIANGFGNRFLWVCVDRSKGLPEGGEPDPQVLADVQARLAVAVAFASGVGAMHRDEEARELWCAVYGDLSEGKPGLTGALLGRAEAHVMRLALLYALLDQSREIGASHLLAALALWQYVEDSVRHVFGDSLGDAVADELLQLLRGAPQGLTRTEIRDFFGRHQSAERLARALGLLLKHKLARRELVKTDGRPAERWYATRT